MQTAEESQNYIRRTSGNKSQVTVIAYVSATGQAIPPFVIFDAKMLELREKSLAQWYGTGLVDTHLFLRKNGSHADHLLVLPHNAVPGRPLLMIWMDMVSIINQN